MSNDELSKIVWRQEDSLTVSSDEGQCTFSIFWASSSVDEQYWNIETV